MKKILLLLLLVTGYSNAQIVTIPDVNFKNVLLSNSSINSNNNSEIELSEALTVTNLNVSSSNIADLTGISSFLNLQVLDCSLNNITLLNLSGLSSLRVVLCNNNQIITLNLSNTPLLEVLNCSLNPILGELNLSENTNLTSLNTRDTSFDTINISGCTSLINFDDHELIPPVVPLQTLNASNCSGLTGQLNATRIYNLNLNGCNNLQILSLFEVNSLNLSGCDSLSSIEIIGFNAPSVDLSDFLNLSHLIIFGGAISSIDLSGCYNLSELSINATNITSIDVSDSSNLSSLHLNSMSQLESIFIKNGINDVIEIIDLPNLHYICCDESEIVNFQNILSSMGFNNVTLNTYCSSIPGGNYNTITGNITFDLNNDGCDDNDLPISQVGINLTESSNTNNYVFTTVNYTIYTLTGNFAVTPQIENSTWFTLAPSSAIISFSTLGNTTTQNFCLSPVGVHADVEVVIIPVGIARPGFDASYRIACKNKGNQPLSGNLVFNYPDAVMDYVSATQVPNAQSAGSLTWNYSNLMPFERRYFQVTLHVNSPQETPAVNIGDVLNFATIINAVAGDELPLDNTFNFNQTVVGSFDPNNKICLEGTTAPTSKIGDYLHYSINFENTGTAPATFVVVKDIIDTAKFDLSSLQIMNSSHAMETRITGNKVEYIFNNINLGPNDHGNVTFKIKTKSTLVEGSTVTNKADIYFDYNFPIETNVASTTFQTLSNGQFEIDNSVGIAPNPTKNNVNINVNNNNNNNNNVNNTIKTVELFDVQGRILTTQIVNNSQSVLDVSNYTNGIYFVKVITEKGSKVEKIIKE